MLEVPHIQKTLTGLNSWRTPLAYVDKKLNQVFLKMIRMQVIVTLLVGMAAIAIAGTSGGISALAGGGAAILGSVVGAMVMGKGSRDKNAGSVLIALLKAEAVKILVIVLALWLVFKFYAGLIPLALIAGLGGAALLSGAAVYAMNEK